MNKKYFVKGNIVIETPFFSYLNACAGCLEMPEGCEILSEGDLIIDDEHPQSIFAEYFAGGDITSGVKGAETFWYFFDYIYESYHKRINEAKELLNIKCDGHSYEILLRQIYLMIVASVDTYIADTILARVMGDRERFEAYATDIIEQNIQRTLHQLLLKGDRPQYEKIVINHILTKSYANLDTIKSLYKNEALFGFAIDKGQHKQMERHFENRHKIAHRNGREKTGAYMNISPNEINNLIADSNKLVEIINSKLHMIGKCN